MPNAGAALKQYEKSAEEQAQLGKSEGARFDAGKNRHDLIPEYVLDELAKVYTYGCQKYDEDNYLKGMKWRKVIGPLKRHLSKWLRGEVLDDESNCHHLAMVMWQCASLMMYEKYNIGQDNRCPYTMDMLPTEEQERRIEMWAEKACQDKLDEYNGLD